MATKLKLDAETQSVLSRGASLVQERGRIEEAMTRTAAEIDQAEAALQQATSRLGEVEVAAALDGAAVDPHASAAVAQARSRIESLRARQVGLQQRLASTDQLVLQTAQEVRQARAAWTAIILSNHQRELTVALQPVLKLLRSGFMLADGLGLSWMAGALQKCKICGPDGNDLLDQGQVNGGENLAQSWRESPADVAEHQTLEALASQFAELERIERTVIEERQARTEAEDAAKRAKRPALSGGGGLREYTLPEPKREPASSVLIGETRG